jgi:beta-1,4-mannosyltransferase
VDKKGGMIQVVLLFFILIFLRLRNRKIVWIMHNKLSHEKRNSMIKWMTAKAMMKFSSLVITHAREGIAYAREQFRADKNKIMFIHHPFMQHYKRVHAPCLYDIILWGTIMPYKGLDRFLKYLKDSKIDKKYSIYIVGRISPPSYSRRVMKFSNERIRIEDRFLTQEELDRSVAAARVVLFTYDAGTVLSSASLMDSVAYDKPIVGPDTGAFKDLAEEGIIRTFRNLPELINLIDSVLKNDSRNDHEKVEQFVATNTWENYAHRIADWLRKDRADGLTDDIQPNLASNV